MRRGIGRTALALCAGLALVACGDSAPNGTDGGNDLATKIDATMTQPDLTASGGDMVSTDDLAPGTDGNTGTDGNMGTDGSTGTDGNTGADGNTTGDLAVVPDLLVVPDLAPPADLMPFCGANHAACANGGQKGLCNATTGLCVACTDKTDDANCTAVYGSSTNPYLCLQGQCVPGNCRVDQDCGASGSNMPTGKICGVQTPNTCGFCSTDAQCQTDLNYGAGTICYTAMDSSTPSKNGLCVQNICPSANNNVACSQNTSDVCCNTVCGPGSCCVGTAGNAFCQSTKGANYTCTAPSGATTGTCTACDVASGNLYTVDPVNGSDTSGTGSGTSGGATSASCYFKTLTRAIQVIGANPPTGTVIQILGTGPIAATAETWPVVPPTGVTITGASGANVVVNPAANKVAFAVVHTGVTIKNLTIDGLNNVGGIAGIAVGGASDRTSLLTALTIKNTQGAGIDVETGAVTIGPGVVESGAGTSGAAAAGLAVRGGTAYINVPAGMATTSFNMNTGHGIRVDNAAAVQINGVPASGAAGTVVAVGNTVAGLAIQQTGSAPAQNIVNGFVSANTTNGNGILIFAGSNVKVRSTVSIGNAGSGVHVQSVQNGGGTTVSDVSMIDLGSATETGKNTFQLATGGAINARVGICLALPATANQTLVARGNKFGAADCSASNPPMLTASTNCAAYADVGITKTGGLGTNSIDTTNCTHP